MTQSVAIARNVSDPTDPSRSISAITDWDSTKNTYTFADGTVYDFTKVLGYVEASLVGYAPVEWSIAAKGHHNMGGGPVLSESEGEKSEQALANLRSAQTIYVEITRVLQITYKHPSGSNSVSIITAIPISNDVVYTITLSELDHLGRAVYETNHEGYIPTFEDLGLDSKTMFNLP